MRGTVAKRIHAMMRELPGPRLTWEQARRVWNSLLPKKETRPKCDITRRRKQAPAVKCSFVGQPKREWTFGPPITVRNFYPRGDILHRPNRGSGRSTAMTPEQIHALMLEASRRAALPKKQSKFYPAGAHKSKAARGR